MKLIVTIVREEKNNAVTSSRSGVRRSNQIASWPVELVFISGGFYNIVYFHGTRSLAPRRGRQLGSWTRGWQSWGQLYRTKSSHLNKKRKGQTMQKVFVPYFLRLFWQCSGSGSTGSTCFWASRILLSSSKNSKKNLNSYCFVTSFGLFVFEKWCKCIFKK